MNWRLIRNIDSLLGIPLINLISVLFPLTNKKMPLSSTTPPKRILLVKFWGIGNIFMLLPSIQALHNTFPDAEIDFLTLESNRDALNTLEVVNRIITIDTNSAATFLRTWKASVKVLVASGYDLAIDFEQFARFSALMIYQIKTLRTIGFATKGQHRHHIYTDSVPYDNDIHITRSFYALVIKSGVTQDFTSCIALPAVERLKTKARNILKELNLSSSLPVIIMHIGTSNNFKERRWSPQSYAKLADLISIRYCAQIILTGLPEEAHLIRATWQFLKSVDMVRDSGGNLSFDEYFALIAVADLIITADTAAVHLASTLNIPLVGLYGPNTPQLYGPWGSNGLALYTGFECSPCITNFNGKLNTCRHPDGRGACMHSISVEIAFKTIEETYLLHNAPWQLKKLKKSNA